MSRQSHNIWPRVPLSLLHHFFSVLYLSTGGWSGLSKMAKTQFSVRFDKASWSFRTLKNGGESDKDGEEKAFAPPSGGGGLGFWASGGQTLPLLPRVWSLCRWLLGARLFLQIKGRCFSFQLDSIKPHRKCLLCDLSKTKYFFLVFYKVLLISCMDTKLIPQYILDQNSLKYTKIKKRSLSK